MNKQRPDRMGVLSPRRLLAAAALLLLTGCEPAAEPAGEEAAPADATVSPEPAADAAPAETTALPEPAADAARLVDADMAPAVAGADGWMYSRAAEADLDLDGQMERVIVTARAEMMRGRPLWDDGQPWQVYVEESDGQRTYLYARFVQLGSVSMRIGLAEGDAGPTVVLLEQLPDRLAVYELAYQGPGVVESVHQRERMLDPTGDIASPVLP